MTKRIDIGVFGVLTVVGVVIAAIAGWVMNVVSIAHAISDPITGMFILRCVGIFVAPLGSILGYF